MNKQAIAETQTNYVHVDKTELLDTVKKNAQQHKNDWESAHAKWREMQVKKMIEFQEAVAAAVDAAKDGKELKWPMQASYVLTEPRHHMKAYERTIRRLEMTIDKEMYLTMEDFERFVMDDWSWKQAFVASSNAYKV